MQKSAKSLLISYYLCTFAPDKEPFLRPFGSKRAELERKQAGGLRVLFTKGLRFYPKLRNNTNMAKRFPEINAPRVYGNSCVSSLSPGKEER